MPYAPDPEKQQLREALKAETKSLRKIQKTMVDGLQPHNEMSPNDVLVEIWPEVDPGEAIDKAEAVLAATEDKSFDPGAAANEHDRPAGSRFRA